VPSVENMSTEEIKKVAELTKKAKVGILTTTDHDKHLVSRPLAMQEIDFDGTLWFFTQDPSPKIDDISKHDEVNVSFDSGNGWVSIAGTASVSHDEAMIDKLWNKSAEAWFEQGREDPTIALIRVDAHTAEYWSTDDPKPVILLKVAKAALTGGQPNIGESHTVEL
jgi:general stress protein 26